MVRYGFKWLGIGLNGKISRENGNNPWGFLRDTWFFTNLLKGSLLHAVSSGEWRDCVLTNRVLPHPSSLPVHNDIKVALSAQHKAFPKN